MTVQDMFERAESSRRRLLDAAERMDQASFVRRRPGVFSVRDLLVHLMDAEDFWIGSVALGGKHLKFTPDRYQDAKAIREDWDKVRQRTRALFETLTADVLSETRILRGSKDVTLKVDGILWQFLTHEIHHSGQVCMLMRENGFEPPETDIL